jgi:putative acetyltransferase
MGIEISPASSQADYSSAKSLIEEYAASLGVDLCFQNLSAELASLHEIYAPPDGCMLLARDGGEFAGCVGVRRYDETRAELKRLYLRPAYRGTGLGRTLAEHAIAKACELGYSGILLDTLPQMTSAQALYRSMGFTEVAPYYPNPIAGVCFMALTF